MGRKFKVGDKVKVINGTNCFGISVGSIGVIKELSIDTYLVKFSKDFQFMEESDLKLMKPNHPTTSITFNKALDNITISKAAKDFAKIRNGLEYGQLYCNSVDSFKAGIEWYKKQLTQN